MSLRPSTLGWACTLRWDRTLRVLLHACWLLLYAVHCPKSTSAYLQERGESFYNPMLKDIVESLMEAGVAVESKGAKCVFVEVGPSCLNPLCLNVEECRHLPPFRTLGVLQRQGSNQPLMIEKSDGGYGYGTTDMAAIKHRIQVLGPCDLVAKFHSVPMI